MCLIGKTQLLCMQCRGIGPHLVARGKSHGFSRVAAGTWGIFSSCDGDAHSKREFVFEVRAPLLKFFSACVKFSRAFRWLVVSYVLSRAASCYLLTIA